jgi:hypothetical protein
MMAKFAEVGYDVRAINEFALSGIAQLHQCVQVSTDIKTYLLNACLSSPDD